MHRIRVMVVDDSALVRRVLSTALSEDCSLEVVGVAADGKIALAKIPLLQPDLITLDVEMPVMDGLQTLTEIRRLYPQLPVIMFSNMTEQGAQTTLEALARGANDYVTKPRNTGSLSASIQHIQQELVPKIQVFCKRVCPVSRRPVRIPASGGLQAALVATPPKITDTTKFPSSPAKAATQGTGYGAGATAKFTGPVEALVIGASTGGPNALTQVIPLLPADLAIPVFIVQHMPPLFTARLAERLDHQSAIRVVEAVDGMRVEPGTAYLAPGDFHMKVHRRGTEVLVQLTQEAPECSCRPAVDVLFRSAADLYAGNLLALVLTGMGQDGMRGCELVRARDGHIIVQDEATSVVWGMPGAVSRAGLAHEILPLEAIVGSIEQRLRLERRTTVPRMAKALDS